MQTGSSKRWLSMRRDVVCWEIFECKTLEMVSFLTPGKPLSRRMQDGGLVVEMVEVGRVDIVGFPNPCGRVVLFKS
jgi:hypothetical protein